MRVLGVMVVVLVSAGVVAPTSRTGSFAPRDTPRHQTGQLGDLIQQFALDLSHLLPWDASGNVVTSPFSIASLLSGLLLGTAGSTYDQLRSALRFPASVDDATIHNGYQSLMRDLIQEQPGLIINIANRLFIQDGIHIFPSFYEGVQHYYGASLQNVTFSNPAVARDIINSWVRKETRGKIPRLLNSVHPSTSVLAVNTVYFKGKWKFPFEKLNTSPRPFNTGKRIINVPMMNTIMKVFYANLPEINAQMIGLPYEGDQFAMFFIIPKEPVTPEALRALELALNPETLKRYISSMSYTDASIFLPRMTLNFKTNLDDALKQLGVTSLFDAATADFGNMTEAHVAVDNVIHETVIDITEAGTEATAATAGTVVRFGLLRTVFVDRPSLLSIRELATGVPLFWGRVLEPQPLLDEKPSE